MPRGRYTLHTDLCCTSPGRGPEGVVVVRWRPGLLTIGLLGLVTLLGSCTAELDGASTSRSSGATSATSSEPAVSPVPRPPSTTSPAKGVPDSPRLVPTGMELVGFPVAETLGGPWSDQIVADGAGRVWFLGPWQLNRFDPETREMATWDAGDDRRFAVQSVRLAPSSESGVWLLDGAHIRLFNGRRFLVDEELPADLLDDPGGPTTARIAYDLAQTSSAVWVSVVDDAEPADGPTDPTGVQVLRLSDDQWAVMSRDGDLVGGYLAVDSDGAVWCGGGTKPKRWDGTSWTSPAGAAAPRQAGAVVADPTGGVWLLAAGARGADRLRRYDGATWHSVDPRLDMAWSGEDAWLPGGDQLTVDSRGRAWVAGERPARVSPDGTVTLLEGEVRALTTVGDRIVGLGPGAQLLIARGDEFVPAWRGLGAAPWALTDVVGLSADEVLAKVESQWFGYRDGTWSALGAGDWGSGVVASDGALWSRTDDSDTAAIVRVTSDGYRTVTRAPARRSEMQAGLNGSVWLVENGRLVQYLPDGTRAAAGRPAGIDEVQLRSVDPRGYVWVSDVRKAIDEADGADDPAFADLYTWAFWDGRRWVSADGPDPFASTTEHLLTDDGGAWALTYGAGSTTEIARFSRGRLSAIGSEPGLRTLAAAPAGGACALAYSTRDSVHAAAIVCYDADGEAARVDLAGMGITDFSLAADGALWVLGPQIARLGPIPPLP